MVTLPGSPQQIAGAVPDPELPFLTITELGILRDVEADDHRVTVTITPTYSGCPAVDAIRADIRRALAGAGYDAEVRTVLSPAWSTDDITPEGRAKLAAAGIAPPASVRAGSGGLLGAGSGPGPGVDGGSGAGRRPGPVPISLAVKCPSCGSPDTAELSRFGATACKALWRCRTCTEPFEAVKPL
jgi:ring-1,2-phenylacetyl-CoA epoxidase subunit PaaD